MRNQSLIHIFGEVLFDHFPDGSRVLGGAPFNVAWHLQALGLLPRFISRIGDDNAGREVSEWMAYWGLSQAALQIDHEHATGSVNVWFESGEPHYDIVADSAYDFIDTDSLGEQQTQGILYHGSLALRNPVTLATLQALKARHQGKVFVDVNLRPPWWQPETLRALLHDADWVKLNQSELSALCPGDADPETAMQIFCEQFDPEILIVTRGEYGAIACNKQREFFAVKPITAIQVVDTVGAGDAFAAVLLMGLQQEWPLAVMLERAQTLASALVGRRGATVADKAFYQVFTQQWLA